MGTNNRGYATYKRGKLYFDEVGWAMIKEAAKRQKKSPKTIVIEALKRYSRFNGKKRII